MNNYTLCCQKKVQSENSQLLHILPTHHLQCTPRQQGQDLLEILESLSFQVVPKEKQKTISVFVLPLKDSHKNQLEAAQ